jgi:hypothetical protein
VKKVLCIEHVENGFAFFLFVDKHFCSCELDSGCQLFPLGGRTNESTSTQSDSV